MSAPHSQSSPKPTGRSVEDPATYTPHYQRRSGELFCENVPIEQIADRVSTPTYVYSAAAIGEAYRSMDQALRGVPHTICYSMKANSNLSIVRLLAGMGAGFDIVSGGELYCLRRAGVAADRVVFSGVGKSREEIADGLRADIRLFNVESEAELDVLASEASRLRRRAPAAIRVNPDVLAGGHPHISTGHHEHKFGMDWSDAWRLYLLHRNSKWIDWQGISAHIGSQIVTIDPFKQALTRLAAWVVELARAGVSLNYIDFGGGLGVRYSNERPLTFAAYGQTLAAQVRHLHCHLLLEPGRSIVAPAGVLITRVLYTKRNRGKTFVIVDAAMNDLMRPALYGAVHPVTRARQIDEQESPERVDVVGPVCESGDCFLRDWPLGPVAAGDLLVLWVAGAYGMTQASNYNSRRRPAEVLVEGKKFRVVRRRESYADLIRGE